MSFGSPVRDTKVQWDGEKVGMVHLLTGFSRVVIPGALYFRKGNIVTWIKAQLAGKNNPLHDVGRSLGHASAARCMID
jgi:hypothetical protein